MKQIRMVLPEEYRNELTGEQFLDVDEIRLRVGQPLVCSGKGIEREIWPILSQRHLENVVQTACRQSVYAHTESIRKGYLTIAGGHRIGICGAGVVRDGQVSALKTPSSLNIRIARSCPGCANDLAKYHNGSILILGPPGCGKTTLLRDYIRTLSDQRRYTVSVADERGELSAMVDGVPQMEIGRRTDILTGIPKQEAVMMLLRTMNPDWIALDEITAPEDVQAIAYASYCGVRLAATAHGSGVSDLRNRPLYRSLMDTSVFRYVVCMRPDRSYSVMEWNI